MGAQEFLHRVEQTGMVSQPLLEELRARVAESKRELRTEILAKLLVDRGELTPAQARKLVALANDDPPAISGPNRPATPRSEPELTIVEDEEFAIAQDETNQNTVAEEEEQLGLVEDNEDEELGLLEEEDVGELVLREEGKEQLDLVLEEEEPEAILLEDDPHLELPMAELDVAAAAPPPPPPSRDDSPELDDILRDPMTAAAEAAIGPSIIHVRGVGASPDQEPLVVVKIAAVNTWVSVDFTTRPCPNAP